MNGEWQYALVRTSFGFMTRCGWVIICGDGLHTRELFFAKTKQLDTRSSGERIAVEPVGPNRKGRALAHIEADLVETRLDKPSTDRRSLIRRPGMASPDNHRAISCESGKFINGSVDVDVGDVSEYSTHEEQIGWHGSHIRRRS